MRFPLRSVFCFSLCVFGTLALGYPAHAQSGGGVSPAVSGHAQAVAQACVPAQWESPPCLRATSQAVLDMVSGYAETLEGAGYSTELEPLKAHCAAATAATQGDYPAYAMTSAYTECANAIADISERSGLAPDPTFFQILIGGVLCLSNDPNCALVENGLGRFK